MSRSDWSREIAALTPFVKGTAIELGGPLPGLIPGAVALPRSHAHGMHNWSHLADGSVDVIVSLGTPDVVADPVSEIQQWRRVLREGGTLALIPGRLGPPLWLISLLNYLGGFEITGARSIRPKATWLVVAERKGVAEIRSPLGTLGPRLAELASHSPTALAELYFQVGTILLQAGDPELAGRCFSTLLDLEGGSANGLLGLGMCHASRDRWTDALLDLQRALELSPNDEQIQRWVQLAQTRIQDQEEAPCAATVSGAEQPPDPSRAPGPATPVDPRREAERG